MRGFNNAISAEPRAVRTTQPDFPAAARTHRSRARHKISRFDSNSSPCARALLMCLIVSSAGIRDEHLKIPSAGFIALTHIPQLMRDVRMIYIYKHSADARRAGN